MWESGVAPVIREAGLELAETMKPVTGGRVGRHSESLAELLQSMQLVYSIDPSAKW